MAKVAFHPAASREYRAEIDWYRKTSPRAARRFVEAVRKAISQISDNPERFAWHDEPFREASLNRFPFRVIYRIEQSGDVLVIALAHASREPGYWHDRT
jgi:plasmid stabilization system protein ParE